MPKVKSRPAATGRRPPATVRGRASQVGNHSQQATKNRRRLPASSPPSGSGQSGSSSTRNRRHLPSSSPHRGPDQSVSSSTRNHRSLPSYSPSRGPDQSSSSSNHPPDAPADGRSGDLSSLTMDQLVEVIRAEIQRPSAVNQAPAARDFPLPPTSQCDACS